MKHASPNPEIAVVMAVRNGAPFLQAAIDSILRQDFAAFEFVIVDDGSTDETVAILDRQTDARLRVFHRQPSGLPASLNFAVAESRAGLIARQDADDLSEPARLGRLLSKLAAIPNAPLAHSACHYDVESGLAIRQPYTARSRALTALRLCIHNPITHGSAMFRKDIFCKIGGYNETYAQSQDYDMWSRMIETGPFAYCPQKLYRLRIHKQSVSARKAESQAKFAGEIGRRNCRGFFQVDDTEAARLYDFLHRYTGHGVSAWVRFIRRDLPRLRYQSGELYLWALVQMVRSGRRMFKAA